MDRMEGWRIFLAVAGLKSFSRAAKQLGRSPQAVTRAVADLEARLGARLLHRTTRSVSLTDAGLRLLEDGRRVLAEFERLESRQGEDAPLSGRLCVTAPVLFGRLQVLPVVTEFLDAHPAIDVRFALYDRVVALAEEGVDVGVRLGALSDSALRARLVGFVEDVLCASPAYLERAGVPRTPEALSKHACITFLGTTPNAERWSFPVEGRRERTVAVRSRLVVNTGAAALDAAVSGLGIVRAFSYQVARLVKDGKLRVILPSFTRGPVPVHIVYLPGASARAAAAFVELAATRLKKRLEM